MHLKIFLPTFRHPRNYRLVWRFLFLIAKLGKKVTLRTVFSAKGNNP